LHVIDTLYEYCTQPQEPYFDLLDRIQQHLLPRTYVEIGVSTGRSLTLALPGTVCIGVDPAPRIAFPLSAQTTVFSQTSDDFFAGRRLDALFGGAPLDLAFIDGMHHFEFALRDFMNLERASNPSTTILIHDCLPRDELHAARKRETARWAGDIWRLILILRARRPDLEVAVADSPPSGLGIVRGLDPTSTVLADHYDEIVEKYLAIPYADLDNGTMGEQLNRIDGDWASVRGRLPTSPYRQANVEELKIRRLARALGPASIRGLQRAKRRLESTRRAGVSSADRAGPVGAP
jgi:hypothetical protein